MASGEEQQFLNDLEKKLWSTADTQVRATLLSRLISGLLRLPIAEKLAEQAMA